MNIVSIDPGTSQSAVLMWDGKSILFSGIMPNEGCIGKLAQLSFDCPDAEMYIEMIQSFGMPAGREVFETCVFIGRLYQLWLREHGIAPTLIYRSEIKMHLCQSMRAKDANIRQALIDRFGPPGTKKQQGVLYGVKSHLWSALAIAVTVHDKLKPQSMEFSRAIANGKDGVIK